MKSPSVSSLQVYCTEILKTRVQPEAWHRFRAIAEAIEHTEKRILFCLVAHNRRHSAPMFVIEQI